MKKKKPDMKKIITFLLALAMTLGAWAQGNGRSLTNTLQELCTELQKDFIQRTEAQQLFHEDYDRQHRQMIDVITATNELSLLLYTQEQRRTFEMAYALSKVTTGYTGFSKGRRPYDQIIGGLNFEVDRYARLIEALRRLPPEMKITEVQAIPDSLLYHNDSLELHLYGNMSSLEKEIIRIAVKDSSSAPFVLDEAGEQYRDSCISYASELLKMYAGNRETVIADSTHYQEAFLRAKEAYDYAEERYTELDQYVYETGQTPFVEVLIHFGSYWSKMVREMRDQYSYTELRRAREADETYYNTITGRAEKAYLVIACGIQLGTLALVWAFFWGLLWLLNRYTPLRRYIPQKSLPLFAVFVGTIGYFLLFAYFWEGSEYVRVGVKNFNTFLWLLTAISGSLLLRVDEKQIRHGVGLYLPTCVLALVVVICRNTFIPDILLNILFTPILLVTVFAQLTACTAQRGKVSRMDNLLGWVSLGIYVIILMVAFFGYTFAALIYLMWWYFMFAALLTVLCVSDLADRYKDSRTDEKSWLYDFVRQVFIPSLLLLSLPWSAKMALGLFDFTDLYTRYFYEPFLHLGEEADGPGAFSISVISVVWLSILFCFMRFLNQALHELWRHVQYASFKHRNKRTQIRANEINLSLGNSIISVVVWLVYAIVIIQEWKIPTGSLGLVAGGLSAGIGIALKDTINNFIYGIQLMGGRLRVGDWIECDGVRGKVTAINYQCVQVETEEGTEMSFLNESLFGKNFNNLTRNNSYEKTIIIVGVAYGTDVQHVREVLVGAMQQLCTKDQYGRDVVDPTHGVYIAVDKMNDSAVDIAVKQYVLVAERLAYIDKAKEVIYNALNEANITIPFPQYDVHLLKE